MSARVPGEHAPGWLPASLLGAGALGAMASVLLFASPTRASRETSLAPPSVAASSARAEAAIASLVPAEASAPGLGAPVQEGTRPRDELAPRASVTACPLLAASFGYNARLLEPAQDAALAQVAAWLREHGAVQVVLTGHADGAGSELSNLRLSRERARAVAMVLERGGVAPERLTVRGLGAFVPRVGATATAAENRRVEVEFRGDEGLPCAPAPGLDVSQEVR